MTARLESWLAEPPAPDLERMIRRLAETEDVVHVAIMPDAHLAAEVCVGAVTATGSRLLPAAVGGDIGCGMVALAFDADATELDDRRAARLLAGLYARIPVARHRAKHAAPLPDSLAGPLSAAVLEARKRREGRLELGTLGRGNHFLELQREESGSSHRLWITVHSGSRIMGPAIRAHHTRNGRDGEGRAALEAESSEGQAYLHDVAWAVAYARESRARMLEAAVEVLGEIIGASADRSTQIDCDHNHVRREIHDGRGLWVHRKGALSLPCGAMGIVPGSMGSATFHVEGRGCVAALCSSAHGAGRALSRTEAKRSISVRRLEREMRGVWFDHRLADQLREEVPSAYKEIGAVMRAQRELVRIVRRLEPVLVFKGG